MMMKFLYASVKLNVYLASEVELLERDQIIRRLNTGHVLVDVIRYLQQAKDYMSCTATLIAHK